jgi:NADH-quinone oxidoreductase subunit C
LKLTDLITNIKVVSPNYLTAIFEPSKVEFIIQKLNLIGFDHVKSVTGVDYPKDEKIELVYHVSSYGTEELAKFILELKTNLDRSSPHIKSIVDIWPSAEYPERETTDLMGVIFDGQPQKERLMLPENFEGEPPLRKDFKLETEGIDA